MSLCDRCYQPGHCCFSFGLSSDKLYGERSLEHPLEVLAMMVSVHCGGDEVPGLPFMPLWRLPNGDWKFWCPNLTREGRCGDYEHRPDTCRSYEPRMCGLCVHRDGAEAGDGSAVFQYQRYPHERAPIVVDCEAPWPVEDIRKAA